VNGGTRRRVRNGCRALAFAALVLALPQAVPAADDARGKSASTVEHRGLKATIDERTPVDHDCVPIVKPPDGEQGYWARRLEVAVVKPWSHFFDVPDKLIWLAGPLGVRAKREAVDVNAFDEVPDNSWFTNRNHVRAIPTSQLRDGPDAPLLPRKPWTIKKRMSGGSTPGYEIADADGKKWFVKLDPRGYPQISSGADMVARTLIHAAGWNVPHNEPVRFTRDDFKVDPAAARGAKGVPVTPAQIDTDLAWGAQFPDGSYSAFASQFIAGKILGSPSLTRSRKGDANDWYTPTNRREIRGLQVIFAWIGDWDTEDHQFLDSFVATQDTLGHVVHYILDLGSTFGTQSNGPKYKWAGYEYGADWGWIGRRLITLGFVEDRWRRAHQETGIPSIGHFESVVYEPEKFKPLAQQPAFRAMTDRDAYWAAKIVASFSDAQIAAAVDAAHYDDPRASAFLVRQLILRRDKTARYWFSHVAPLDFFHVDDGTLRFRDLAVDTGLDPARAYDAEIDAWGAQGKGHVHTHADAPGTSLPLSGFGDATRLELELRVHGKDARPAHVTLTRQGGSWIIARVEHA